MLEPEKDQPMYIRNTEKPWTDQEVKALCHLAGE